MGGRKQVTLRHPDLPPEQTIAVPEQAVPHYGVSGWVVVEDPQPTAAAPADKQTPADAGESSEPAPDKPSRRRTTKESET